MIFKKTRRLQTQFYLAYLLIILLFLFAFGLFFYIFLSRKLSSESLVNLYDTNLSVKESVDSNIRAMDTVSININYSSIVRNTLTYNFDLAQASDSYKALADLFVMINGTDSRVNYIYLYDIDGNCLQVDSVQKLTHIDLKSQPWYEPVMAGRGAPYLSTPYDKTVNAYTRSSISLYRTYVDANQKTAGIVETVKDCKTLFSPISKFEKNSKNKMRIFIYNSRQELIYPYKAGTTDPQYPHAEKTTLSAINYNGIKAQKISNPLTGQKEYTSSLYSSYTGWTYYVVQDEADVLGPLHQLTKILLLFVSLLAVFAAVLSFYLSKKLASPIAHLKHIIQRMKLSNLGAESPGFYPVFALELQDLYNSFEEMSQNLRDSRDMLMQSQHAELESRSLALLSQMSPHFFYNSLSGIMILAENKDTDSVIKMCQTLSKIMRYVSDFNTRIVTVFEEMDYINQYLYCMKMRNQSSLKCIVEIDKSLMSIHLPKLCIHPLVENALKYGTNCTPPWSLAIHGMQSNTEWTITVSDSGPGFSQDALEKLTRSISLLKNTPAALPGLKIDGMGLVNIYIRLSIYFKDATIFEYGNDSQGHAYVTIGEKKSTADKSTTT